MKGLDSWALLEILEGSAAVRAELKRLRGQELATTEACLLELACVAARGGPRAASARANALSRLRRRLTVLPIDVHATEAATRRTGKASVALSPLHLASLGAFEAAGCDELLTSEPSEYPGGWSFKVRRFPAKVSESR